MLFFQIFFRFFFCLSGNHLSTNYDILFFFDFHYIFQIKDSLKILFADCGKIKYVSIVPTPKLVDQKEKQPKLLEILNKKTKVMKIKFNFFG